jgi:hypothetical protein
LVGANSMDDVRPENCADCLRRLGLARIESVRDVVRSKESVEAETKARLIETRREGFIKSLGLVGEFLKFTNGYLRKTGNEKVGSEIVESWRAVNFGKVVNTNAELLKKIRLSKLGDGENSKPKKKVARSSQAGSDFGQRESPCPPDRPDAVKSSFEASALSDCTLEEKIFRPTIDMGKITAKKNQFLKTSIVSSMGGPNVNALATQNLKNPKEAPTDSCEGHGSILEDKLSFTRDSLEDTTLNPFLEFDQPSGLPKLDLHNRKKILRRKRELLSNPETSTRASQRQHARIPDDLQESLDQISARHKKNNQRHFICTENPHNVTGKLCRKLSDKKKYSSQGGIDWNYINRSVFEKFDRKNNNFGYINKTFGNTSRTRVDNKKIVYLKGKTTKNPRAYLDLMQPGPTEELYSNIKQNYLDWKDPKETYLTDPTSTRRQQRIQ